MTKKDRRITKFIDLAHKTFGSDVLSVVDYWNTHDAIGLQRDDKLIYISIYGCPKNEYFYECELLVDDPEIVYISQSKDNVSEEKLLEVMSEFFGIKF